MADTNWNMATPVEAGFAPDLEENFGIARQAGTLPNLHGVVAARGGRIFFERYLAGPDAGRSSQLVPHIENREAIRHHASRCLGNKVTLTARTPLTAGIPYRTCRKCDLCHSIAAYPAQQCLGSQ